MNDGNIGKLLMTGISGTSLTTVEKKFLTEKKIGGVLLFSRNYENPAQLAELINSIQSCRSDEPLFIAVDQEGGRVQRFKKGFIKIPSMFELANLNSPKLCFQLLYYVAEELKVVGVNINFAPVCDIWFNEKNKIIGDRSFGNDIESVSKFVTSAIRGLQKGGILSCAKHFPGHGQTLKDSHFYLPFLKTKKEEIINQELPPFIKATKAKVDFVMMAHLQIDSIDSKYPTSLSSNAYTFLRESLKFKNLVITDDMQMGAITKKYNLGEAAFMAINAGADMIEYRDFEATQEVYQSLISDFNSDKFKTNVISQKVARIEEVKNNYFKNYRDVYLPEISKVFNNVEKLKFIEEFEILLKKSNV